MVARHVTEGIPGYGPLVHSIHGDGGDAVTGAGRDGEALAVPLAYRYIAPLGLMLPPLPAVALTL
jgi:hypothetical protein